MDLVARGAALRRCNTRGVTLLDRLAGEAARAERQHEHDAGDQPAVTAANIASTPARVSSGSMTSGTIADATRLTAKVVDETEARIAVGNSSLS